MIKKKKTHIDHLENTIKTTWRKHKRPSVIKALHTEVVVEPQPFIRGHLNPQIAEFLIELYLQKAKASGMYSDQIEVKDGVLKIKDQHGKLIAETSSPKIVREYLN